MGWRSHIQTEIFLRKTAKLLAFPGRVGRRAEVIAEWIRQSEPVVFCVAARVTALVFAAIGARRHLAIQVPHVGIIDV